ncbi:MAG: hypothetical protein ACYC9X_13440, partial [Dehalococcoidia bacterium]
MLQEPEQRQPLRERELRRPRVAREPQIARQPRDLPPREALPQRLAHRRRPDAAAHERTIVRRLAVRDERPLAPPHAQQRALHRRLRHEVRAPERALDRDLVPGLVEQREQRLRRDAGKLLRRLALDDEKGVGRRAP